LYKVDRGHDGGLLYKVDNAAKTSDSWKLSEVRVSVELFEVRQYELVTEFVLLLLAHGTRQHITTIKLLINTPGIYYNTGLRTPGIC